MYYALFTEVANMRTKKRFSVIFLILVLFVSLSMFMVACDEEGGVDYPITKLVISTLPKTEYYVGDKFELANAQITVYYENDTKEVVDLTLNMISEFSTTEIGEQTLTIKYKEAVTYLTINVVSAPVYSLQVESTNHKTEYVVGEQLNVDGLKVLVTYSNGYTSVIEVTTDMITGFSTESTGEKQIVIAYGNRTCNMAINVVRRSVMQMQLVAPSKLDYIVGDVIDLSEGQLFVSYNDNTSEYLNLTELQESGDLGILIAGEENTTFTKSQLSCEVTLFYNDRTFSFAVMVEAKKATSAAVTTDVKAQIFESAEPDFSDGVITITYNNGEVAEKSFYDEGIILNLDQFDINRLGVYSVGINADGLYFEYNVEVISARPAELVILPSSETFYQDEAIDVTLWQYQIKLDNGKFNLISSTGAYYGNVTEAMFIGNLEEIDTFKVGKQNLTFTLTTTDNTTLTTSVEIEILHKQIVDVEITPPTKVVYSVGDVINLSGAEIIVIYNSGDRSDAIAVTADMLTTENGDVANLDSFTTEVQDKLTVFVNYADNRYETSFVTDFDIKVIKKATSLEIISQPKAHYVLGDTFDYSDWEIIIHYSDESTATINDFGGAEWTFENINFDQLGTRKIRLYYGTDVYVEYVITVSNEISRIYTNRPFIGFVTEGKAVDYNNMQLNVVRENGELTTMDISSNMSDFVANKVFVSNSSSFVPAYVDASVLAKEDNIANNWSNAYTRYYVRNVNGYVNATQTYNEEVSYYVSVAEYYSENWIDVYYNFYVYDSEKSVYAKANNQFSENSEYYLAAENIYDVNIEYLNKVAVLKLFVESKEITSISVDGIAQRYIVSDTEWDLADAELTVNFNNNTSKVVLGSELLVSNNGTYTFMNNGIEYALYVGIFDNNGAFVEFTLAELIDRFANSQDQYQTENIVINIVDSINEAQHFTEERAVYCFENLVKSIVAVVGEYDGTALNAYQDQKVYVNEGLELMNDAFVVNDTTQRVDFEDKVYLCVSYENGSYEYTSIRDAINVTGFDMSGYNSSKAGSQIIKIRYLLSDCTLALEVRANVINSLNINEQSITVIEGVELTSGDINITATLVDADGQPIPGEVTVDFMDVISSYDHTQVITFSDKDENGYYTVKELSVNYGSIVSNTIQLIVRKKSLIGVSMKDMPKQIYIEDATGATNIDYTNGTIMLLYNNGTNKTVSLTDASVKIDSSEFNANLELTGAGQQSQTIRISYTDENNITHNTQYNVIIKDRKYLALNFESLPYDNKYSYQYGTGESAGPKYSISYYQSFDGESMTMSRGDGKNGTYELVYINNATGYSQSEWPTEVGVYTLSVFYEGDPINNEFFDNSVTIEIMRKEIVIKVSDHSLVYGDIIEGNSNADIGIDWEMKGLVNGVLTDNPYCYTDTSIDVVEKVEFDIFNTLGNEIVFRSLTLDNATKFVINANVGEYVIVPKVTLKSANYYISTTYTNVNASLIINKREIIVVSTDTSKIYGSSNPEFRYEVFDYVKVGNYLVNNGDIGDMSELSEDKLQSVDFDAVKNAPNKVLPLGNHNRLYYFFNEDYSNLYEGNGNFTVSDQSVIFSDNAIAQYRLTRPISDNENVGKHIIYGGDGNILPNYTIYFVKGTLDIEKADLEVDGTDIGRYYGTVALQPQYSIAGDTSLKYFDSFDELFGDYFDASDVIFYNKVDGTYVRQITDNYYDNWCVLYKNVRLFVNEECTEIAGYFLENVTFNVAGVQYTGSYTALPVDIAVGNYYAVIDFTNLDLHNYNVSQYVENNKEYAYTINIQQVDVSMNVESIIVAENEYVTDDNSRFLSSYFEFESNGLKVVNVSREDLVNAEFIDKTFKNKVLEVVYKAKDGSAIDYVLSDSYLTNSYVFYKKSINNSLDKKQTEEVQEQTKESEEDVESISRPGTYTIGITSNTENYSISLASLFVEHNQNYVEFFHSIWGLRYEISNLQDSKVSFDTDAYMLVLPTYANIAYGKGEANLHQEVYDNVKYSDWTIETFMDKTGSDYVSLDNTGISFSIKNRDELMNSISDMVVGTYDGIMTYSFFDTPERSYLYLGDNVMLSDVNAAQIINYILFGLEGEMKYSEEFEYTVTPIVLDAEILGIEYVENDKYKTKENVYFDESEKVLALNLDGAKIFDDDTFALKFDIEVTYNARTETNIYKNVEISAYHHKFKDEYLKNEATTSTAITSLKLLNAGTYKIKLATIGNMNYTIGNNIEKTVIISSINLPIYLTENITDKENRFNITKAYTGKSIQPIDYTWKAAADENADYVYGTTTCRIVNEYYPHGETTTVKTTLAAAPRTLRVFAVDENGNYPVNVKKNGNEIDGYEISYNITSDYVNYSVVFVYKNSDNKYVECGENENYKLIIEPKEVYIFNFHKINTKVYDGLDAEISSINMNIITVMEDEITANKQNIKFKFERDDAEGSTFITNSAIDKQYELIEKTDLSSVGTLKVTAYFSDNYTLIFDKGVYDPKNNEDYNPRIGVYTITKKTINLDLYSKMDTIFTKEYDYYGLTSSSNINYTGDFNDIANCQTVNAVIDDFDSIFYTLDLKYFNEELSIQNIQVAETVNSYTCRKAGENAGFDIGYYWFNLRGVFDYNGDKIKFATVNEDYANWLGWNYAYKIADSNVNIRKQCDGIFHIEQRQVYLIINPAQDVNGVIKTDVGNVPNYADETGRISYVYEWPYDGTTYTDTMLTEDINVAGGNFEYGLYVLSHDQIAGCDVFVNIKDYTTIGDVPVGILFDYSKRLVFNSGSLSDSSSSPIDINYQDLFTANPNFSLINTQTSVAMIPLVLNVEVKLANTLVDGKSEITYKDTNSEQILVYEINPLNIYPNSLDAQITTKEGIIEIVNSPGGRYYVTSETNKNEEVEYSYKNGKKVNGFYVDSPSSFYDCEAGVYNITGSNSNIESAKYKINIVSVPFMIVPRPIYIDGITRTYFDKQFSDYKFSYKKEDDDKINGDIEDVLQELNYYIRDNTNISASIGSYEKNGDYYVTILKENFVSSNASFSLVLNTNFVPMDADTSTYIYVPLTINKATILVDVDIQGDVEFGDLITSSKYSNSYVTVYSGFEQLLSTYEYTYANSKTGEIYVDTYNADAQAIQNALKARVEGTLINKNGIVELIASTEHDPGRINVSLEDYIEENDSDFGNFEIEWGQIYYTIIKKLIDFEIEPNVSYHKDLSGSVTGIFSALWSEKDSLFYDDISNEKLSYSISIGDFTLKYTDYTDANQASFEEQIKVIFGLTINDDNKYVYKGNVFESINEFLANTLDYIITDEPYDNIESTAAGLRYIKITEFVTNNFRFNYISKQIMLYPEIDTLGEYSTEINSEFVNVISDVEAIADGVTISETTHEINGLSMYIQLNFSGLNDSKKHQYFDVMNYGEYNIDGYSGMSYTREIKVKYCGRLDGNSSNLIIQARDYVYAQIEVIEVFYATDYEVTVTNEIVSNIFVIKFMEKSQDNVIMDIVSDKGDGALKSQSSTECESFDELLNNTTDTYYYNIVESGMNFEFEGTFDILTVRAKLLSKSNSNKYSYEIIVYENDYGRVVFGVVGGSSNYYYVRMKYNYYYTRTTHSTVQADSIYYTFMQDNTIVAGSDISDAEYYTQIGNGYKRVTDTVASSSKVYYTKVAANLVEGTTLVGAYYVDYSESIISESLVEMFDGANHTINIQIDTLGEIANVNETTFTQHTRVNGNECIMNQCFVTADKKYYLYVTVDNTSYIFSYIGGEYVATYDEMYILTHYQKTNDTEVIENKNYFTFVEAPADLTIEEFSQGVYYAYSEENQRFTIQTSYKVGIQYYTISQLVNSEITNIQEAYETITDDRQIEANRQVRYNVNTHYFFAYNGTTGVVLNNVHALISKYSIKERHLITATNNNYIANVILVPGQSDVGEHLYIVSKSEASNIMNTIENAISSIAMMTISNGTVDDKAYNTTPTENNVNNRITYNCRITSPSGANVYGNIDEYGLYILNYEVSYNYGDYYSTVIYRTEIKLIVSNDMEQKVKLKEYVLSDNVMTEVPAASMTASSDNLTTLSASNTTRYFYSEDLKNYNHSSIVFDNYTFDGASSETWLYFRASNIRMDSLANKYGIDGLFKEIGFGLRIKLTAGVVTSSLYISIYNRESNTEEVSVYCDETKSVDWENKINIINIDYLSTDDENVNYIIFRLYQKNKENNETSLAWQSYIKPSLFGGIPQVAINDVVNGVNGNQVRHMGFSINNASFRLLEFDIGRDNMVGVNLVKYGKSSGIYGDVSTGLPYTDNILAETDKVFVYSDKYDVPLAYSDNTIEITFSVPSDSETLGFDINFTNTTPYISDSDVGNDANGQRTVYMRYRNGILSIGYAKYSDYSYALFDIGYDSLKELLGVTSLNDYFMDGEKHTITICVDKDRYYDDIEGNIYMANASEYLQARASNLGQYQMMYVRIDNSAKAYAVTPYLNDLTAMGFDDELGASGRDQYFINEISYLAFTIYGETKLQIHDIVTYNSSF